MIVDILNISQTASYFSNLHLTDLTDRQELSMKIEVILKKTSVKLSTIVLKHNLWYDSILIFYFSRWDSKYFLTIFCFILVLMVNIHLLMKRKGAIAEFFFEPIDQQVIFVLHLICITFENIFPSQIIY